MKFKDLRLGVKQGIGFGTVLAIMAAVNVYSLNRMAVLKDEIDEVNNNWLPRVIAVSDINISTSDLRANQLQHAFATADESKQGPANLMQLLLDRIDNDMVEYQTLKGALRSRPSYSMEEARLYYSEEEKRIYSEFEHQWEEYQDLSFEVLRLSLENENQGAVEVLNGPAREVFDNFSTKLEELVMVNRIGSLEATERAEDTFHRARSFTRTLVFISVVFSAVFALGLVRFITVPVRQLAQAAKSVAQGDIGVELEVCSADEIGQLGHSFNQMTEGLRHAREKTEEQATMLRRQNEELGAQATTLERQNDDLEEALQQLQEAQQQLVMKEKMASLGNLVAGVAHEINNPVGAIHSAAETSSRAIERVVEAFEKGDDIEQLRTDRRFCTALDVMGRNNAITITASERITTIVQSLKNFARLDEAELQQADVREGIDSTLTLLHHVMKGRVEVIKEYGEVAPILCYPNQLNQVFMNLLANAAEAIEGNGTITISTAQVGTEIQVKIADSGGGIPAEIRERIFDPGITTKGRGVGTGLGLSISYNIVHDHQGRFEVQSKEGVGSEFTIVLPVEMKT